VHPGAVLSRYVLLEELGRGGMGVVLRAYDPRLQREVALKELRTELLGPDGAASLVAEARAMAKLSHSNVVAVFDVEELGPDHLMLVMEYVAGQTLRAWLREEERAWPQIVERFVAAGRGLVAAHTAGLLHRDFKPANVLVAAPDIVKVTDFGLARPTGTEPSQSRSADSDPGIMTDTIAGTPRYMAPEQHECLPLTPAADQYAFCVALWEALCGVPPFFGRGLSGSKQEGPPPWSATAPRRLGEILRRGLDPDPARRWPTMDALLVELLDDPRRRRNRWLVGLGGVAIVGGVAAASWQSGAAAQSQLCSGASDRLQGVWDDSRRARASVAMQSIEAPYAVEVWNDTRAALDAYAAQWVEMYTEACEATSVRGEQSSEVLDLEMACLHRASVGLGAVAEVLGEADGEVVQRAHILIGGLPPLARCADVEALQQEVEPPLPPEEKAVEQARAYLAQAKAQREAGNSEAARAHIDEAETLVTTLEYEPIRTEFALERGLVHEVAGEYPEAEEDLREAMQLGAKWGQRDATLEAASMLMFVVGYLQDRGREALLLRPLAQGLAADEPLRQAVIKTNVAAIMAAQREYEQAEAGYREALAVRERALGPDDPVVAASRSNLANVLDAQGKHEEAEVEHRRALEVRRKTLGAAHPDVASSYNNLAIALEEQGRLAEAEVQQRLAIQIRESALGSEHPSVAMSRNNLAIVFAEQGRLDESVVEQRRAIEIWNETLGSEHPRVASSHGNLAITLQRQGKLAEAAEEYRVAMELWDAALGPDNPQAAISRHELAGLMLSLGQPHAAREYAQEAFVVLGKDEVTPRERGGSAFVLARALWADDPGPEQRARARTLAQQAAEAYAELGDDGAAKHEEIQAWLRQHR
jgi:serine/threonine-protein kinase